MVSLVKKATFAAGAAGKFAISAVLAILLASFAVTPAFAAVSEGQTGSGQSSLVLRLKSSGESGGTAATGDAANPDNDGDGLGDNLAFTVPVRIDFTVLPDGTLVGPSAESIYLENESVYGVHVSSLRVSAASGWNIAADAKASSASNSVDFTVGPKGDPLNAAAYLKKAAVSKPAQWNMNARTSANTSDRVPLSFSGHINNVATDVAREMTFGQIEWYVTPGKAA